MCAGFIRHVFNCLQTGINPVSPSVESAVVRPSHFFFFYRTYQQKAYIFYHHLPKFIAYAFHRTRLPLSVAYHSPFLLSRLKSKYPASSCAFSHRLFLTSYSLSLKVICDDTNSNKVSVCLKKIVFAPTTNFNSSSVVPAPVPINSHLSNSSDPPTILHYLYRQIACPLHLPFTFTFSVLYSPTASPASPSIETTTPQRAPCNI